MTIEKHLESAKQWIIDAGLQDEWEVIGYGEKRGNRHYINMKHLVCGTEGLKRKTLLNLTQCSNRECIKRKHEETCLKNFGVKHQLQSIEIQQKIKETNLKKYGVEYPAQSKQIQDKIKQTNLDRYGVEFPAQLKEVQDKMKQTNLERYDVEFPIQLKEIQEKVQKTNIDKYGVKYLGQSKDVIEKIRKSLMKDDYKQRTFEQIDILTSKEKLENFILSLNRPVTLVDLSQLLRITDCRVGIYIDRYDLRHLISTDYRRSNAEKEVEAFLNEQGIKTIASWKGLDGKEIDIYIPSLKLGIEYNGLYWHSSLNKDKYYHHNKRKLAEKQDIHLIQIFEDEWLNNKDLVKRKLLSYCGLLTDKIYARNCIVKECPSKERNEFLNKYHIQGADRANYSFGLYDKDTNELVSIMSFISPRVNLGNKRNNIEGVYELSRFACSKRCIGGFQKLLKHFISKVSVQEIYTYADLRWTNLRHNIYLNNKFEFIGCSEPNYFYLENKTGQPGFEKRVNRWNYTKHKCLELFPESDSSLTEQEIMADQGYTRIYDCGTAKYRFIIEKKEN